MMMARELTMSTDSLGNSNIEAGSRDKTPLEVLKGLSADPFAIRQGRTLAWRKVSMTLHESRKRESKKLLDNVWGKVPAGQTTAIMGASGAGKTSLLNILAGRSSTNKRMGISAEIMVDGFSVDPTDMKMRRHIAFVPQEGSLERTATPKEAIRFSAKLRLPKTFTEGQLEALTDRVLVELGLPDCADTIIGGGLLKGISGGEKKRTSVGVELVVKPRLLFLDEPTSGLDSFNALQVCNVLKSVANAGCAVLFTIHQPSSEIFSSFDNLLLLNKGRLMYHGSTSDVAHYFAERGYPVPGGYSTADHIMKVAQSNLLKELEDENSFSEWNITGQMATDINLIRKECVFGKNPALQSHASLLTQTKVLFVRELKAIARDTGGTVARLGVTAFLAILIGTIFFSVGRADRSVQSNVSSTFGALLVVGISSMMGSAQSELTQFPMTRPVFLREYSTNHYSVLSYFVSRFSMEATMTAVQTVLVCVITYFMVGFQSDFFMFYVSIYAVAMSSTAISVFLGCLLDDEKAAKEMFPILTVPQMLFAGFFVSPDLIPSVLRWAQYVCGLTYSVRVLLLTEFDRDCGSEQGNDNCVAILESVEGTSGHGWVNWIGLVSIFFGYRLTGLFFLWRKGSKFFY